MVSPSCPLSHRTRTTDIGSFRSSHTTPAHRSLKVTNSWRGGLGVPSSRCSPSTERSAAPSCAFPSHSPSQLCSSGALPPDPNASTAVSRCPPRRRGANSCALFICSDSTPTPRRLSEERCSPTVRRIKIRVAMGT